MSPNKCFSLNLKIKKSFKIIKLPYRYNRFASLFDDFFVFVNIWRDG